MPTSKNNKFYTKIIFFTNVKLYEWFYVCVYEVWGPSLVKNVPSHFRNQEVSKPTWHSFRREAIYDLLVKNVPNHFLRRSHSPVHCSLFHKRKSVVCHLMIWKISTFSHHFCLCPIFSSNMSLSRFWLLIDHWPQSYREYLNEEKEVAEYSVLFQIVLSWQLLWQRLSTLFSMTSFHRYYYRHYWETPAKCVFKHFRQREG